MINQKPADFTVGLETSGLHGRVLHLPAANKEHKDEELLFIYGSHSSLERWWGLAVQLSNFGNLTMPDLPGFGGMTPFYKIGKVPTIDNLADWLADFITQEYDKRKLSIAGMSLGFVIVTRMLQRHPQLTNRVEYLISIVGFAHHTEFTFSRRRLRGYLLSSKILSRHWPASIFKYTALQPWVIKLVYHRTHNAKEKFLNVSGDEFRRTMATEVELWQINDIRTQFQNYVEMFTLDNTGLRVELPVYHVAARHDRYFDNQRVRADFQKIFTSVRIFYHKVPSHAPTIIATPEDAAPFIPKELRRLMKNRS